VVADGGSTSPSADGGVLPALSSDAAPFAADGGATAEDAAAELAHVVIKSRPTGARVYDAADDRFICTTPCREELPAGKGITLELKRRHFRSVTREIEPGRDDELVVEMRRLRKAGKRPGKRPGGDPFGIWHD
jgi:hypothetical protein